MGLFSKKPKQEQDLSIPANRQLNFNTKETRLEWMDSVNLWEDDYFQFRTKHGWKAISGGRNSNDRFKMVWQIGEAKVRASFDTETGIVTEKVL